MNKPLEPNRPDLISRASGVISLAAAFCVLVLASMVFVSVFFRYFLHAPLIGAEDFMSITLALLIFAAYPYVTEERKHVQVDLLVGLFRHPVANRLRLIVIDLVVLGMTLFMALRLWQQAEKFLTRNSTTSGMHWPLWPVAATIAVLTGLAVLFLLARILRDMRTTGWGVTGK